MDEKNIIYFIMSHTIESRSRGREFVWPVLPDPNMGEDFCDKIRKEHEEIRLWMKENPDKVRLAEQGFYLDQINRCCWIGACSTHRKYSLNQCYGVGEKPSCYVGGGIDGLHELDFLLKEAEIETRKRRCGERTPPSEY